MDTPIHTIIAYTRVSTEEQARDGISLDAQRDKIQQWRALHAPDAEVIVFSDDGVSGASMRKRPGLEAALAAVRGPGAALLVYSLSRLSRSTKDTLAIAERLEKQEAELVSLSERIDTTTAAGKMFFRLMAVLAEFERDQISERTRVAMQELKRQGKRYSRFLDYPDHVAERCAELRDRKMSYRRIAKQLVKEGYETSQGGPWQPAVIRRLARRAGSR